MAAQAGEAADDVLGEVRLYLEIVALVDDAPDHLLHVVGLVGAVGHDRVEGGVLAIDGIRRCCPGSRFEVVLRQERQQVPRVLQARLLVRRGEVRDPERAAWVAAPPSSSNETSSPVTVFTTSGPVMNMYDDPSTMRTKSVIAGE